MRLILAVLFILVFVAALGRAQTGNDPGDDERKKQFLYEWTDSQGTVHITDSLGKVPEEYRPKARKMESQKGTDPGRGQELSGSPDSIGDREDADEAAMFEWQQRLRDQERRLLSAETRYQNLQRERDGLFPAGSGLAPIENRLRYEELDRQMKAVQAEIDDARRMMDTVIPEEARKAGVPPGWLRR